MLSQISQIASDILIFDNVLAGRHHAGEPALPHLRVSDDGPEEVHGHLGQRERDDLQDAGQELHLPDPPGDALLPPEEGPPQGPQAPGMMPFSAVVRFLILAQGDTEE